MIRKALTWIALASAGVLGGYSYAYADAFGPPAGTPIINTPDRQQGTFSVSSATIDSVRVTTVTFSDNTFMVTASTGGGGGITAISKLTPGATNFVFNQNTLQSGATFFVSSATVQGMSYVIGGLDVTGTLDGNNDTDPIFVHVPLGSTTFGIRFDGFYTDGIRFDGEMKTTDPLISNIFTFQDSSLWAPANMAKTAWSVGAGPLMYGSTTATALYGFLSAPSTRSFPPQFVYTSTLTTLALFEANPLWGSGRVENLALFDGSITAIIGSVGNLYGLRLDDITGATTNYAIKTKLGLIQYGSPNVTSALFFDPSQSDPNIILYDQPSSGPGGGLFFKNSAGSTFADLVVNSVSFQVDVASVTGLAPLSRVQVQNGGLISLNNQVGTSIYTLDTSSISYRNGASATFYDNSNSHFFALKSSASLITNNIYIAPSSSGTAGQLMQTDGENNLSFVSLSTNAAGSGTWVMNRNTLQVGASFYVQAGTVNGLLASGSISSAGNATLNGPVAAKAGLDVLDSRGASVHTLIGNNAFPNAPGTTNGGISVTGLLDVSFGGVVQAGIETESTHLMNIGVNFNGQGDLNANVQGSYIRYDLQQGEAPFILAIKDNLSLVNHADVPAIQISESGTTNLGRGHALAADTTSAELHIKSLNGSTIPLIIQEGASENADLTDWNDFMGNNFAFVDKKGNASFQALTAVSLLTASNQLSVTGLSTMQNVSASSVSVNGPINVTTTMTVAGLSTLGRVTSSSVSITGPFNVTSTVTISNKIISYNGNSTVGNGVMSIVASTSTVNVSTHIASTLLFTPPSYPGEYMAYVYLVCSSTGSAGNVNANIVYTDEVLAQTSASDNASLKTLGAVGTVPIIPVHTTSGNINFSATMAGAAGNTKYDLFIYLMRIN